MYLKLSGFMDFYFSLECELTCVWPIDMLSLSSCATRVCGAAILWFTTVQIFKYDDVAHTYLNFRVVHNYGIYINLPYDWVWMILQGSYLKTRIKDAISFLLLSKGKIIIEKISYYHS